MIATGRDIDSASTIPPVHKQPVAEAKVAWLVLNRARDAADAQLLLDALGLAAWQAQHGRRLARQ